MIFKGYVESVIVTFKSFQCKVSRFQKILASLTCFPCKITKISRISILRKLSSAILKKVWSLETGNPWNNLKRFLRHISHWLAWLTDNVNYLRQHLSLKFHVCTCDLFWFTLLDFICTTSLEKLALGSCSRSCFLNQSHLQKIPLYTVVASRGAWGKCPPPVGGSAPPPHLPPSQKKKMAKISKFLDFCPLRIALCPLDAPHKKFLVPPLFVHQCKQPIMNFVHVDSDVYDSINGSKENPWMIFFLFIYIICPLNYRQPTYLLKTAHMTDQPPKNSLVLILY